MADDKPKASVLAAESAAQASVEADKPGSANKTLEKKKVGSDSSAGTNKTSSKKKTPKKPRATKTGDSKNPLKLLRFLVFLIFLGGLAAGSWYGYQKFNEIFQGKSAQIELLNQQTSELTQVIIATQQNQQNIEGTLSSFIGDQQRQMQALADRIRTTEGAREGDWLLAEAQYLVRLADQRLLVSRDTDSAVELLSGADELLRELAYPELASVREALIADISALRSVPSIDYQGLYFQITAVAQSIDGLSLAGVEGIENWGTQEQVEEVESRAGIWASFAASVKSSLDQLIVVRKAEGSAEWIVDAEGESALRNQMDLLIMQSLSAVLSGNQEIYQSALQVVAELLQNNFQATAQRDLLVSQLLDFSNQPVQADVPDISSSLRAMQQGAQVMRRINQGD
jgi:uroporphyrin-3 C-methyltransferase